MRSEESEPLLESRVEPLVEDRSSRPEGLRAGLEGVPAAATALSDVQGQAGRLILCGRDLADFAAGHGFESAAAEFWAVARAEAPAAPEAVRRALGAAREAAFARVETLRPALEGLTISEGLRLGLASLTASNAPRVGQVSDSPRVPQMNDSPRVGQTSDSPPIAPGGDSPHFAVTGAVPVLVANVARLERGEAPVAPDASLPHVADFLRMLRGREAPAGDVEAVSTYLVTVMDHGMNASTFTARVIASTQADLVSAVVGAYGALTGPLHGGAPEPVLDMLDEIGRPERAAAWIDRRLDAGERIMGFGHRIYRVRDPRADVLKRALEKLQPADAKLDLARAVEAAALAALRRRKPERTLETNVEFYTAMLLDALGLPRGAFTPVFAMGRVVGWTAHAFEQRRTGRLIRPASIYVGSVPDPVPDSGGAR